MKVFDVDLAPSILEALAVHAERDYPDEACGIVLGKAGSTELARVVELRNVQNKYHQRDPASFPRTARDAFRLDDLELMRVLEAARAEGFVERVLYHSHCDAGAYFSPEDRAMAVRDGIELMPGIVHVVVSVRDKRRSDIAAYRWNEASSTFEEARVGLGRADALIPELGARAMEGKEAARPIRPFGGALVPRRVTREEREKLSAAADKIHIRVDSEEAIRDLIRFELGLYSPLSGFLRTVELRAIDMNGRLLSGTPWRTPVALEIAAKKTVVLPASGSLVELVDRDGRPLAAMGLQEITRVEKELVRLAGPVFVYDSGTKGHAAEMRAELLRRGMKQVLAVGPSHAARAASSDLTGFDAVMSPEPISGALASFELPLSGRDPWLDAVMAQNLGATHVWVEDAAVQRAIEDALEILPWKPRT